MARGRRKVSRNYDRTENSKTEDELQTKSPKQTNFAICDLLILFLVSSVYFYFWNLPRAAALSPGLQRVQNTVYASRFWAV